MARGAIALGEPTDFIEQRADAYLGAAEVFRTIVFLDDAREALRNAERLYEAKDVPVMLDRVRALRTDWGL